MSDVSVQWQIDGYCGKLRCGPLAGHVEPAVLGERFRPTLWRGTSVRNFFVLLTAAGEPYDYNLVERHIRGRDLVDVFPKLTARISNEAIWRASFHRAVDSVQLELVCSTQTDLLDSNPIEMIQTHIAPARVFHCEDLRAGRFGELEAVDYPGIEFQALDSREHLTLFRNDEIGLSYAEMVHPTDFVSAQHFSNDAHLRSSVSVLFPERMEKGVIRRGRICGWFLPAENDLATAVELARQFVDEPLPLTA